MNLTDLKTKSTQELIDIAKEMGLENMARSRKQEVIFAILKPLRLARRQRAPVRLHRCKRLLLELFDLRKGVRSEGRLQLELFEFACGIVFATAQPTERHVAALPCAFASGELLGGGNFARHADVIAAVVANGERAAVEAGVALALFAVAACGGAA